jgi:hypothetical protein
MLPLKAAKFSHIYIYIKTLFHIFSISKGYNPIRLHVKNYGFFLKH